MPSLAELQRGMADRILAGAAHSPDSAEILEWLKLPSGVDAETRLAAYVNGYPARIAESLAEAFPAIAKITGGATFAALARRYTAAFRGEPKNLNFIGAGFADFLHNDPLLERLPFLCDLAEFEWALLLCFHSEVRPPLDLTQCDDWSLAEWASARIRFQSGVRIARSDWPLRELRAARDCEHSEIDIDLVDKADCVLVYRRGFEVVTEELDALEYDAIAHLSAGGRLGELMDRLAADGAHAERAGSLLARWVSLGLVTDCETHAR